MDARKTSRPAARKPKKVVAKPPESASVARLHRVELVMNEARRAGLVGGPKDTVIRGRVSKSLVRAAKKRAGVVTDTELLEIVLSSFALEDDFGEKFLERKGTIDPDLPLEL